MLGFFLINPVYVCIEEEDKYMVWFFQRIQSINLYTVFLLCSYCHGFLLKINKELNMINSGNTHKGFSSQ